MKLSVYKRIQEELITRYVIMKASLVYTFREDSAFVMQNWAALFSTASYTLSFAFFIKILYSNIDSLAGYSEMEMLLFLFMSQLSFYLQTVVFNSNLYNFTHLVNRGELDLYLSKPLPLLFYISFKRISILTILQEVVPALLFLGLLIDWSQLPFTILSVAAGFVVFIIGLSALYFMDLLSILPVFWLGKNEEFFQLSGRTQWLGRREIPFEGFPTNLRIIFSTIFPILISTGLTTSVLLGKSDPLKAILFSGIVVLVIGFITMSVWKKALKSYTSASS